MARHEPCRRIRSCARPDLPQPRRGRALAAAHGGCRGALCGRECPRRGAPLSALVAGRAAAARAPGAADRRGGAGRCAAQEHLRGDLGGRLRVPLAGRRQPGAGGRGVSVEPDRLAGAGAAGRAVPGGAADRRGRSRAGLAGPVRQPHAPAHGVVRAVRQRAAHGSGASGRRLPGARRGAVRGRHPEPGRAGRSMSTPSRPTS